MLKKTLLTILVIFLFTGTISAQEEELPEPGILPGNPIYFLKTWTENIGTFFTFGEEAKAERIFYLAEKRLAEANELSQRGEEELAERTIARYEENMSLVLEKTQRARNKGKNVDEILIRVAEATYKHQDVLTDVYEKVPENAKEAIERAMQESMRGHEEALEAIPLQEREKVQDNVQERLHEVEQKVQQMRDKGVSAPNMPSSEEVKENLPNIDIENIKDNLPNVPNTRR